MQRKSLALVAIAITLLSILFLQLTVVQAAVPQQAAVPADAGEPEPLTQPIRIRIRQSIPLTISLAPAAELTAMNAATTTLEMAGAETNAAAEQAEIGTTEAPTATAETAAAEPVAASETITEATVEPPPATGTESVAAMEELTATEALTAPAAIASVPITLEIELDFVVTQTLTTTVPASATIQLPDFQTRTVPIEVVVSPLVDGEVVVDIVPVVAEAVAPQATEAPALQATEEITAAATATATVEASPTIPSTLAAEVNGIPVINTTVNAEANLRAGPGTTFEIVSEATAGQPVQIAAVSEDGVWYLLATGAWIAAFLVDEQPTNVPVVNDQILAAIQGTLPEPTPTPTSTPEATPVPAATQAVAPTVTVDANLRSGPGTTFDVIGGTITGQKINIVGRNADGTWFRLDNGGWVLSTLVANSPALESVPVVNDDGTPAATQPAVPAAATGLGGLLPTPTPQAAVTAPTAAVDAYLTAAAELVGQFDVVLTSVDSLLAEVSSNPSLIADSAWITRMNAALTLLRRTSASVGELDVPAGAETIQGQLETAAASYIQAAQALSGAVQAADTALLTEADALVSAATADLTVAENAIIAAQGQ